MNFTCIVKLQQKRIMSSTEENKTSGASQNGSRIQFEPTGYTPVSASVGSKDQDTNKDDGVWNLFETSGDLFETTQLETQGEGYADDYTSQANVVQPYSYPQQQEQVTVLEILTCSTCNKDMEKNDPYCIYCYKCRDCLNAAREENKEDAAPCAYKYCDEFACYKCLQEHHPILVSLARDPMLYIQYNPDNVTRGHGNPINICSTYCLKKEFPRVYQTIYKPVRTVTPQVPVNTPLFSAPARNTRRERRWRSRR